MTSHQFATSSNCESCIVRCSEDLSFQDPKNLDQSGTLRFPGFLIHQCGTLQNMLNDLPIIDENLPIPIPCSLEVGNLIVEYAKLQEQFDPFATMDLSKKKHESPTKDNTHDFESWETDFLNKFLIANNQEDQYQKDLFTFQLVNIANFLEYYELLHFAAKTIATIIQNSNTENEIRQRLSIRDSEQKMEVD